MPVASQFASQLAPVSHVSRAGVVVPVRTDVTGRAGPTPGESRGPRWRRTSRGFHVPAEVDASAPEQRIVEAASVLPAGAGVTGWGALRWCGGVWFDGMAPDGRRPLPVPLAVGGRHIRQQPGFVVTQEGLAPRDLMTYDGLSVTTPVRSVCFLMRYAASTREAAVAFDMAAYSDLVDIEEITRYVAAHRTWTGIAQARRALALVDENSWSPWESRMCHLWEIDAGFGRPLRNRPVFDRHGRFVGTPDLLDPVSGTAGEYDGVLHLGGAQRARDVRREAAFRALGLEYVTMLAGDRAKPGRVVERMRAARSRARWEPAARRAWTIEPPPWWVPTATVEQRRNLTDDQRARWLGLRRRVS